MDDKGDQKLQPIDEPEPLARLGDCLHSSFTADNHESLGDDMMRSMLHLSREAKPAMHADSGSDPSSDVRERPFRPSAEAPGE